MVELIFRTTSTFEGRLKNNYLLPHVQQGIFLKIEHWKASQITMIPVQIDIKEMNT